MKWLDTKEVKDQESLTADQIAYLRKPSITILGPFNVLARWHWDLIIITIGVSIALALLFTFGFHVPETSRVNMIPAVLVEAWFAYFGIKHGRRLAWNRSNWKSFDAFVKSENRWTPWGWLGAAIIIGDLIYGLVVPGA